jgi:hypothetical protein
MRKRLRDSPPATRLEEFLRLHKILAVELARAAGCSRAGITRMRFGKVDASRRQMAAVLAAVRLIRPDMHIAISDLFNFDDGPLPGARTDWQRVKRPGRPRKGRDTRERNDQDVG